jgi:hypothetical protein
MSCWLTALEAAKTTVMMTPQLRAPDRNPQSDEIRCSAERERSSESIQLEVELEEVGTPLSIEINPENW